MVIFCRLVWISFLSAIAKLVKENGLCSIVKGFKLRVDSDDFLFAIAEEEEEEEEEEDPPILFPAFNK